MENGFSFGCCLAVLSLISSFQSPVAQARVRIDQTQDRVPGELVVKLNPSARAEAAAIDALERRLGDRSVVQFRKLKTDTSVHVVRLARDADLSAAIDALKKDSSVEIAEPNFMYYASDDGMPNDPDFGRTWGLNNTGQADQSGVIGTPGADINVLPLWKEGIRGNRNVLVAVIDTGVDWTHPDLAANLYTNPTEIPGNGKDDDANGFVDDVHGWNFAGKSNNSSDDHNHGTHCSGTIGGVGNNGVGVVGVNWEVSLLPVKFLDANGGGNLADAVESVNYATKMGVNIMSNSWGGGGFSETLKQAIEKSRDAGILFVAAAGNDTSNNDGSPSYPASYPIENVVAVAATSNQDGIASFSNYGAKTVHVAAPGLRVYSTIKGGGYNTFSGTSMACPHVAGVAALMLSAHPEWSFSEIKERLIKTSDPVSGLRRKVLAKGRVNAYNALHGIIPPSTEPDESLWKVEDEVVESAHPYQNSTDTSFTISRPGAKYIRVHFEKIAVEARYDKVYVQTKSGEAIEEISKSVNDYVTDYVTGDTLVVRLKADSSNTAWGFKVDKVHVIY